MIRSVFESDLCKIRDGIANATEPSDDRQAAFELYRKNAATGKALGWMMSEWHPDVNTDERVQAASFEEWKRKLHSEVSEIANRFPRILANHAKARELAVEYAERGNPQAVYFWNQQQNVIIKKRDFCNGRVYDFCHNENCICQMNPPDAAVGGGAHAK
jgi:hypothetical protein